MLARARVVAVDGSRATVRPQAASGACGCAGVCGLDWRALAGQAPASFDVWHDGTAQPAQVVTVRVPDGAVSRAAARVYMMPLAGGLAAVAVATLLGAGDGVAALAGLAALAGSALRPARGRAAAAEPIIVPAPCAGMDSNESTLQVSGRTT